MDNPTLNSSECSECGGHIMWITDGECEEENPCCDDCAEIQSTRLKHEATVNELKAKIAHGRGTSWLL